MEPSCRYLLALRAQTKPRRPMLTLRVKRQARRPKELTPTPTAPGTEDSSVIGFPSVGFRPFPPTLKIKHTHKLNLKPLNSQDPQIPSAPKHSSFWSRAGGIACQKIILRKGAPLSHISCRKLHPPAQEPSIWHRACAQKLLTEGGGGVPLPLPCSNT